jgi:hypothetical protein
MLLCCGGHDGLLPTGTLLLGWGLPIALFQAAHHHRGDELLLAVIVKLDHDALFTAGHHGAQTELQMFDLRTLGERIGSHKFSTLYSSDELLRIWGTGEMRKKLSGRSTTMDLGFMLANRMPTCLLALFTRQIAAS